MTTVQRLKRWRFEHQPFIRVKGWGTYEGLTLEMSAFQSIRWSIYIINSVDKPNFIVDSVHWVVKLRKVSIVLVNHTFYSFPYGIRPWPQNVTTTNIIVFNHFCLCNDLKMNECKIITMIITASKNANIGLLLARL